MGSASAHGDVKAIRKVKLGRQSNLPYDLRVDERTDHGNPRDLHVGHWLSNRASERNLTSKGNKGIAGKLASNLTKAIDGAKDFSSSICALRCLATNWT